uniref:Midasin n=1 Tax=Babesia bovis TaxID=5865 RepID=A7AMK8_BABBO|eukprot:XP_001611360.1 ATPase associated with various cellular activities (AAA) family protein [Babesia bovis T2Bo]
MLCKVDVGIGSVISGENCKEYYIRELATRLGIPSDYVSRIYTDETTDVKSLIGYWVCSDKVGEFKFIYGVLTSAMRDGRWLIFDDNISDSVACLLYSICENGSLLIPELNEVVHASSTFHIFITTKNVSMLNGNCKYLPAINIPPLTDSDCRYIISKRWPSVSLICDLLVSTFFSLKDHLSNHRGFNISDLFKIVHRLLECGTSFEGYLSSATKGSILEAFYGVLLAGISCSNTRDSVLSEIGERLGLSGSSCSALLPLNQIKERDNTSVHLKVLHQLMSCYLYNEPVLLVGETGTGKTAIVQQFAKLTGNVLKVYVFSDQSEAEDLIGGFYPDNMADVCKTLFQKAIDILLRCCVINDNLLCFFEHVYDLLHKGLHRMVLRTISACASKLSLLLTGEISNELSTLRGDCNLRGVCEPMRIDLNLSLLQQPLDSISEAGETILQKYVTMLKSTGAPLQFKFEDGLLIRAMQEGWWILLDEINLAPSDLLQRFVGILSNRRRTFELYECGSRVIDIHENFRIFACMNPPTIRMGDVVTFTSGKKELPSKFRMDMTEIFVDEVSTIDDISIVIGSYISVDDRSIPSADIAHFYLKAIELCRSGALEDGSYNSPTFTLRNLVRCLYYIQNVMQRSHRPVRNGHEAFVDGFLSCFASSLGPVSYAKLASLLPTIPRDLSLPFEESVNYVRVEGYWIRRGTEPIEHQGHFIVTPNIAKNLKRLCRILSGLRVPVLLEGPTAAGKTSLVQYLCAITGHRCVRINNHEHTDISEYLGQFVFDVASSKLRFNYGPIVTAMKQGDWVILDELNLAPSQVLEAINRILDDNREIYIPETGETIKSHPEFMIFATQNPANSIYGGRKQLSKAFCNRFVQLYIDCLDSVDLQQVLHQRCLIPLSRAERIVSTFQALLTCPLNSMAFERHSVMITLRDLIRWGNRVRDNDECLAYYGWCVIADKLRDPLDKDIIRDILERCCLLSNPNKPKKLVVDYTSDAFVNKFMASRGITIYELFKRERYLWFEGTTDRLLALLIAAIEKREPVLLVGDTGIGKTTVCQLLARLNNCELEVLNLSKNTEASDFIGSFRPIRGLRSFHANMCTLVDYFEDDLRCHDLVTFLRESISIPISQIDRDRMIETLNHVNKLLEDDVIIPNVTVDRDAKRQKKKPCKQELINICTNLIRSFSNVLFEWVDGPLTRSMEKGHWFLADEISLADDAVLEKMNSVLESESTLTIPEAGGRNLRVLKAHEQFRFLATMNPSGDHGKRELSPALLNRFTVIYIPTPEFDSCDAIRSVVDKYIIGAPDWIAFSMSDVVRLYNGRSSYQKLTLRDIIKWVEYMGKDVSLDSFLHGAHVVFLDKSMPNDSPIVLRDVLEIVCSYVPGIDVDAMCSTFGDISWVISELSRCGTADSLPSFALGSKSSLSMFGKILRALKVDRPILLEGEPGVGKTASIGALATIYDTKLVRVNLSEHTDIMDLFGSDIPSGSGDASRFRWHNGPVLDAAINGHWAVLDELNLASQQVLEGLNALLDHRRETFIPELDRFIKCHDKFRLFGCQNPVTGGGGRKHLPKSFLNRFTILHYPSLGFDDYCAILRHRYPGLSADTIHRVVQLLFAIRSLDHTNTWDWNLRDCIRLCDALSAGPNFDDCFRFIFMSRLDSKNLYDEIWKLLAMSVTSNIPSFDIYRDQYPSPISYGHGTVCNLYTYEPIWMQSHEQLIYLVAMGTHLNFPVLLVGPSLSGKKSLVKSMARSRGQVLTEITMLPCFDTGDLLGGFEQVYTDSTPSFRWVDSALVRSIECGTWVLLSGIHNTNPAILDRLNSLLESGGSFSLNESGDCNRVIRPHPNFRIFMTADSSYVGKISRAFRNRCLEINMRMPYTANHCPMAASLCPFMADIVGSISDTLSNLMEFSGTTIDIFFKCCHLMDGARLVHSLCGRDWHTCVGMSLCSCVIGAHMDRLGHAYHGLSFLKRWSMIDLGIFESTLAASQLFVPEVQPLVTAILQSCLQWYRDNSQGPIFIVTDFLSRCLDFESWLQRDWYAAKLDIGKSDPCRMLWYLLRSVPGDFDSRMRRLLEVGYISNFKMLQPWLDLWMENNNCRYDIHTALYMMVSGSMDTIVRALDNVDVTAMIGNMRIAVSNGASVKSTLDIIQFLHYLLYAKASGSTKTVEYIYNKLCLTLSGTADCNVFLGYSTPLFRNRILDEVGLMFELQRLGMDRIIPCGYADKSITADAVLSFVDSYLDSERDFHLSIDRLLKLPMKDIESPNTALTFFFNQRVRFLGCWISHQHIMGAISSSLFQKMHEYAMGLLNLYIELQYDLPGSTLAVITGILISLRKISLGAEERLCVYSIMLDSWSVLNTDVSVELDPLEFMTNLVNGTVTTKVGDRARGLSKIDPLTSLMHFWDTISVDNGMTSLDLNIKRIDCLRRMLYDCTPAPQWSPLFMVILFVSSIVSRSLNIDQVVLEDFTKSLYSAIIREEPIEVDLVTMFSIDLGINCVLDATDFTSEATIKSLSTLLMHHLRELCYCDDQGRLRWIPHLWRIAGLLLMSSLTNSQVVISELREQLEYKHMQQLQENLQTRLDTFTTLDTLSDGDCYNGHQYIRDELGGIQLDKYPKPSLRYFHGDRSYSAPIGDIDTVSLMLKMRSDLNSAVQGDLRVSQDFTLGCDIDCIQNFRRYIIRDYIVIPEMLIPILIGLGCLSFALGPGKSHSMIRKTEQMNRVSNMCSQFPLNCLKRVSKGDLISLSALIYDSKGCYDIYCYVKCLIDSVRGDLLVPVYLEPLKYSMLMLAGIYSRLKAERSDGQAMRMSLLQSCIAMAQQKGDGVCDLFPSQQEIVRAIVRDCGSIEEFESLDVYDDVTVDEPEQNRDLRRITACCKVLTRTMISASAGAVDIDQLNYTQNTRQVNAALCLGLACGLDTSAISGVDYTTYILAHMMGASEEHFGYKNTTSSFYRSVDIDSCLRACELMDQLGNRVSSLLNEFESQQQLLDVRSFLNSMSKLKLHNVTQALLVTLLENLVARVHKWNSISHSMISLRDITSELEQLVLDLRKRELHGWYSMIDERLEHFREDAYGYLIPLIEMCSGMHESNVPISQRVSTSVHELTKFTLSAPVAHFHPILDMIRAATLLFKDSTIEVEIAMGRALRNTLGFLELWASSVGDSIEALAKEARSEVGELVKRINWCGTDYVSISLLLQKQKSQMSSAMRRFQEGLLQPVQTVIPISYDQWVKGDFAGNNLLADTLDPENDMDITGEESDTDVCDTSRLITTLASNIEYINSRKTDISRIQITRITGELGRMMHAQGYSPSVGHNHSDWLDWLDFGIDMQPHGCEAVKQATDCIFRSLHIIHDLDALFARDSDKLDSFGRNVDVNLYGYLVTMLRAVQSNVVEDTRQYTSSAMSGMRTMIVAAGSVYRMDRSSYHSLISLLDDVYEACIQGHTKHLLNGSIRFTSGKVGSTAMALCEELPGLLVTTHGFRVWLQGTPEYMQFRIAKQEETLLISGAWLDIVQSFASSVRKSPGYSSSLHHFFAVASDQIVSICSRAIPENGLSAAYTPLDTKNGDLPLACVYLAQLISCISRVEPPAEEPKQQGHDQWSAGTGLEDGTGAKNVSEDVDPDEGMFDNFAKQPGDTGEVGESNPGVDIDMEFDGDVLDIQASRECSDIEEENNPGNNDGYDDLHKTQLDTDLVDDEGPIEDADDKFDIEGVSMEGDFDTMPENEKPDVDTSGQGDEYNSEVNQPEPGQANDIEDDKGNDADIDENLLDSDLEPGTDMEGDQAVDTEMTDMDLEGNDEEKFGADGEPIQEPAPELDEQHPEAQPTDGKYFVQMYPMMISHKRPLNSDICPREGLISEGRKQREYEETPYGIEGRGNTTIHNEDKPDSSGAGYEENSTSGTYWGDAARTRGGTMQSFLDTIERLENPSESASNSSLEMTNILDSENHGANSNHAKSSLNELDDSSTLEGVSMSIDGQMSQHIDDVHMSNEPHESSGPMEVMDRMDQSGVSSESVERNSATKAADAGVRDTVDYNDAVDSTKDTSSVFTGDVMRDMSCPQDFVSHSGDSRTVNDQSNASAIWRKFCEESMAVSTSLCEQMRMILEPTLRSSLQGDYKTGKRISIKKLMAFIASNYQRDKIWLRRSKPSKRNYRVVLAIDNSRSMSVSNAGVLALKSFACIYQAMSLLEVGELSVCKFGGNVPELLLDMGRGEDPSRVISGMTFDEESHHSHETGLPELFKYVLRYLDGQTEHKKILVIISDGKFNKDKARPWIQAAISSQVVPLLVILDSTTSNNKSILQMKQVREIDGKLCVETFLSNFPFPYYAAMVRVIEQWLRDAGVVWMLLGALASREYIA